MAVRSVKHPVGVVEDVLIKVKDFYLPCDFIVLDMEEDREVPIILGRPFLRTGKAMFDSEKGHVIFRVNDVEVKFDMNYEEVNRCAESDILRVELVDQILQEDVLPRIFSEADEVVHVDSVTDDEDDIDYTCDFKAFHIEDSPEIIKIEVEYANDSKIKGKLD